MRIVFCRASVLVVALMLGFATGPMRADVLEGGEYFDEQNGLSGGNGYSLQWDNGYLLYSRLWLGQFTFVWRTSCDTEHVAGCASGYGNHQPQTPQDGPGDYALMQTDGNFVIYSNSGAVWATNTEGNSGATLNAQNDANLVVYSSSQVPLWSIW